MRKRSRWAAISFFHKTDSGTTSRAAVAAALEQILDVSRKSEESVPKAMK